MRISEIFKSIQGESTRAGRVCSFVRLSGCNLHCSWCDTEYARAEGTECSLEEVVEEVANHRTSLVEVTGGEPLLQQDTAQLCRRLLEQGFEVMVETNGSRDISVLPTGIVRIVDIKCPESGMANSFLDGNYRHLAQNDECKLVIADRSDFDWALRLVREKGIHKLCGAVIFSPVLKLLEPRLLASWILSSDAPVRLGLQLHKFIWGDARGV